MSLLLWFARRASRRRVANQQPVVGLLSRGSVVRRDGVLAMQYPRRGTLVVVQDV